MGTQTNMEEMDFRVHSTENSAVAPEKSPDSFSSATDVDRHVEKWLIVKIDGTVGLLMCIVSALLYMDKIANSVASLMGFQEDLRLLDGQYQWISSSFYFGFLAFQVFGINLIFPHFHTGIACGSSIVIWGVVVTCIGAAHNYATVIALRVLQGFFEGCVMPTFILITSQYYKPHEHYSRTNFWYGASALGEILIDCLAYGLYTRKSIPITPWRLVFIILGTTTIGVGVIFTAVIPSRPVRSWWMTVREKQVIARRHEYAKSIVSNIKWYQVREALSDPQVWLFFIQALFLSLPNGGITNYNAIIIHNLGYSTAKSYLMDMPSGAAEIGLQFTLYCVSARVFADRRVYYAVFCACLLVMALFMLAYGPNHVSLAGYYIWFAAFSACYALLMSCISSNVSGTTKKATASSVLVAGFSVGNLCGPQSFKDSEAPSYHTAKTTMAASSIISLFLTFAMFGYYIWQNKRRDARNKKLPEDIDPTDLTDGENPEFRYSL